MKTKLIGIFYFLFIGGFANAQNDTSAYETQRNRINQLLSDRSNKFGQYDNSLRKRSGIFGLKTKKDMQFSNDILTEIVLTDNHIFTELKVLLDYKDFEKKDVETRAVTVESRIDNYMLTITRLQQENEKLKSESDRKENKENGMLIYLVILLIALLIAIFYLLKLKKLRKTDN